MKLDSITLHINPTVPNRIELVWTVPISVGIFIQRKGGVDSQFPSYLALSNARLRLCYVMVVYHFLGVIHPRVLPTLRSFTNLPSFWVSCIMAKKLERHGFASLT